jgi:hypothetical protein
MKVFIPITVLLVIIIVYLLCLHHFNLDLFRTFLSEASGAAFGGFIGSLAVWLGRDFYVHMAKKPSHVVTYFVADNKEEVYGKLLHHRGERVDSASVKERIGGDISKEVIKHGLWEYKLTGEDLHKNKAAFYGPYSYDLTEPGTYEASFYYFGRNFVINETENPMLFHLEVLFKENYNIHKKIFDLSGSEIKDRKENIGQERKLVKGKKYLYHNDFAGDGGGRGVGRVSKIRFYYDGVGEFEFKAYVPDGPSVAFENAVRALKHGQVYFYKVVINRIFKIEIPESI